MFNISRLNMNKEQMLFEASLIIESIDWIEKRINKVDEEFEKLLALPVTKKRKTTLLKLQNELINLISKLQKEDKNIDIFIVKYNIKT